MTPHPFTLRQLQYALAVSETRSFRAAASRCAVSQPALSAQLAALERSLGVRLFERDRRGVLPTPAAAELLPRLAGALLSADDLLAAARRLGDPLAGTLRIGILPTIAPYLLQEAVPLLLERHRRLTVLWTEERTATLLSALRAGALDAALLALVPGLEGLAREVVGRDDFLLAVPAGHPLAKGRGPARPSDLEEADVLLLDDGHCFREQALAFCSRAKARERSYRATSLPTLAQMTASGAGVTLLPRLAAATEGARAHLVLRPFADPAPHRTLALVFRRGSPLAAPLRSIAGALRDALARTVRGRHS